MDESLNGNRFRCRLSDHFDSDGDIIPDKQVEEKRPAPSTRNRLRQPLLVVFSSKLSYSTKFSLKVRALGASF